MQVLFISAKQGGGKTTLATELLRRLPDSTSLKFADLLYEMQNAVWDVLEPTGLLEREIKSSDLLQVLGDFARSRRQDIFVEALRRHIEGIRDQYRYVIVDDGRFENEMDVMKWDLTIRLECNRNIRKQRTDRWRENETHVSEISLDARAASGAFNLYFDTGQTEVDAIAATVLKRLNATEPAASTMPDNGFWSRFYHGYDLVKAPRLLKEDLKLGLAAYDLLNRRKYEGITEKELQEGFIRLESSINKPAGNSSNLR